MVASKSEHVFGRNPVYEVVRAGRRRVHKLVVAKGVNERGVLAELLFQASDKKIPVERVSRQILDQESDHHQGVMAVVSPFPYGAVADILEGARVKGEPPLVLLLDALQDTQNLGTLLRTAEAVGAHGVVIPLRRGASVTPAVVSASAGASEHLVIAPANLAQTIKELKQAGVWIVGMENRPEAQEIDKADLGGAIGLVVGSEGRGMRKLVRQSCDFLIRLPMRGQVGSLNAAVAGSIALYAVWKARAYQGAGPDRR
jgi:23S rRNA (guanosine2251-2'-O)-methyltransferase